MPFLYKKDYYLALFMEKINNFIEYQKNVETVFELFNSSPFGLNSHYNPTALGSCSIPICFEEKAEVNTLGLLGAHEKLFKLIIFLA